MKKILFFVLIIILFIVVYMNLKKSDIEIIKQKKDIQNDVEIKMPTRTEKKVSKFAKNVLIQLEGEDKGIKKKTEINIDENEIIRKALKEIQNIKSEENISRNSGFSVDGSKKIASRNPHELLSVKDMPKELQQEITELLKEKKRLGYDELTENEINDISNIEDTIEINKPINESIKFKLSKLSDEISSEYEYIGHAFPKSFNAGDDEHDTVRRVFEGRDNNQKMIIEETELNSERSSNMLSEFINTNVNGYPAEYSVKKSNSGKTYGQITWNTENRSYTVYLTGESENSMDTLQSLAENIKE